MKEKIEVVNWLSHFTFKCHKCENTDKEKGIFIDLKKLLIECCSCGQQEQMGIIRRKPCTDKETYY